MRTCSARLPVLMACTLALAVLLGGIAVNSVAARADAISRDRVIAALPQLERLARRAVDDGGVPGLAIGIVLHDELVFLKGFGLREMGKPDPVDADTVFQLASLSKPVSSTVVAALVSAGVVGWDTKVSAIDPAFQLHDAYPTAEVTIRDLFAHRSGLPGDAGNELEGLGYGRDAILRRLRLVRPASSFRAGYSYSNFGLTEGAVAAAKPTGRPWEEVAADVLYRPLGMSSTSSRYADFVARPNRAALHIRIGGRWSAKLTRQPDAQSPAGGVSSTVRDLAQWMRLELGRGTYAGKGLIDAKALDATHVPLMARGQNPVTGAASFYGLGWNVEYGRHGVSWGHAGAFSTGARTLVTLYPDDELGIVVLSNAFPTGVPEGLADSFFDLVFDGRVSKDWITDWDKVYASLFGPAIEAAAARYGKPPATASPAMPLAAYVGRYANDYLGEAVVGQMGDGLSLKLGPDLVRNFQLRHFDRDLFVYYPAEDMPNMASAVTFEIGPDGKAAQITIEDLNSFGLGMLKRVGE